MQSLTRIGPIGRSPFLLVSAPTHPYKTLQEFVASAKANPDKLSFGSAGVGTVPHMGTERLFHCPGLHERRKPLVRSGAAARAPRG